MQVQKNKEPLMIIIIAIITGMFITLIFDRGQVAVAINEVANSCTNPQYAYGEDISGNMLCSLISYSQLIGHITGLRNETSSLCPSSPHQFAENETAAGVLQCSLVQWTYINGIPTIVNSLSQGSHTYTGALIFVNTTSIGWFFKSPTSIQALLLTQNCASNKYATGVGNTIPCSFVNYNQLIGHIGTPNETASSPTACASHKYLTQVTESAAGALTFTCVQPSYSDLTGHVGTANETASTPTACNAGNWLSQQTEASSGALTPTCTFQLGNRLTGDTGSISGTKSSGLTISLLANTNYIFNGWLYVTTTTTSGVDFQIHALAAGASLILFTMNCHHSGVTVLVDDIAGFATAVTSNVLPTTLPVSLSYVCSYGGTLTVGANPTTLQIDFVATATGNNVKTGSFVYAQVIT